MSDQDDYKVGYRRPPRESRFKKGDRSNKNGRPKGARNKRPPVADIDAFILDESSRVVPVRIDGVDTHVPTVQAILRSANVAAIKGDTRAQRLTLEVIAGAQKRSAERRRVNFEQVYQYKRDADAQRADAAARGLPRPEFPVDPDKIICDPITGEVTITTLTTEQLEAIAGFQNYRCAIRDEIKGLISDLQTARSSSEIKSLSKKIAENFALLEKVEKALGGPFMPIGDGMYDAKQFDILKTL